MNPFTEEYFLRGKELGLSNFENYRWLPDQTIGTVAHIKRFLGAKEGESLLDCGCATGNYVRAFRMIGIEAYGQDISEWAIANADESVKPFLSNHLNGAEYDYTFSKDMMEHVPPPELARLVIQLLRRTRKRMLAIVPLAESTGGKYVHEKEEQDVTHVNRWTLHDWIAFLQECSSSFVVSGAYQYPGIKPGCFEVRFGYGFLTMDRI